MHTGAELDTHTVDVTFVGVAVKHSSTDHSSAQAYAREHAQQRTARVTLPARLTWKDQRGATRFATVVTRNVSDYGVYVECQSPVSIPLFRLVQFQLERDARESDALPGVAAAAAACSAPSTACRRPRARSRRGSRCG